MISLEGIYGKHFYGFALTSQVSEHGFPCCCSNPKSEDYHLCVSVYWCVC